jgi:hypothetical protein
MEDSGLGVFGRGRVCVADFLFGKKKKNICDLLKNLF